MTTDSPSLPPIEWEPYFLRGARCRMRDFIVRGSVEFELCAEGGHYVIRRTERKGDQVVSVTETARGRQHEAEAVWARIVHGLP